MSLRIARGVNEVILTLLTSHCSHKYMFKYRSPQVLRYAFYEIQFEDLSRSIRSSSFVAFSVTSGPSCVFIVDSLYNENMQLST